MFSYRAKLRKKTDMMNKLQQEMDLSDVSDAIMRAPPPPNQVPPQKRRPPHAKVLEPQYVPRQGTDIMGERAMIPMTNIYETESGYVNNEMTGAGLMAHDYTPEPTWKKLDSIPEKTIEDNILLSGGGIGSVIGGGGAAGANQMWNTPKLLELDINRFMMDHNNIMSPVRTLSNRNNLPKHPRSYLSVSRTLPHDAATGGQLTPKHRNGHNNNNSNGSPKGLMSLGGDGVQKLPPIANN